MTYCMHCGKPFTDQDPAHLGLLLHKVCYQVVGGRPLDPLPAHTPTTTGKGPIDAVTLPPLPAHHTHGDQQTDILAQKVNYEPAKPTPLNTLEMNLNEVLIRLRISKTSIPRSFDKCEFRRDGELVFIGDCREVWQWLRKQGEII